MPDSLTLLDISGTTRITSLPDDGLSMNLVKLYAAGSGLTGTLPALPDVLTYLDVSGTGITGCDTGSISSGSTLKTLLAGGAPLAAVPSPLPAATLEYVVHCG